MADASVKVLLIEDNSGDARLILEALAESRSSRFEVRRTERLAEGLKVLREDAPAVVLLDLSLPDCLPKDTVSRVTAVGTDQPVIVLTGLDDPDFSRELVKRGAQDYLVKGQFDGRLLERSISYALERKRNQLELARVRDEALEAAEVKSAFLANMSHEIRTPMNAIIGMTQMLLDTSLTVEQQEFAESVWTSARSLLAIVNDVLDFSKLSSGKLTIEEVEFCPADVIEDAVALFTDRVQDGQVQLESYVEDDVPVLLRGDPLRLRQVLINLLGNAIKFTAQGRISVSLNIDSADSAAPTFRITVTDTGSGISPEAQGRLFEAFYQGDTSTTRRYGGTGLGLAISAQLVKLMGGVVGFDSLLGRGSTFWFTFKTTPAADAVALEADEHRRLSGKRALLASGEPPRGEYIARLMARWGIEVVRAVDGEQAQARFREADAAGKYDFAVIDADLRPNGGLELARQIHHDSGSAVPTVICYSLVRRPTESEFRSAGVSGAISCPIRPSQLYNSLVNAVEPLSKEVGRPVRLLSAGAVTPIAQISKPTPETSRARILLVEDHVVNQRVVLKMLERLGYRADSAGNGVEAIHALRGADYDLILMDCQMPEMDGYEATRAIRREFVHGRRIAIIGVTAHALVGDRQKCLDAGMDDYLSKPLLPEDLAAALSRWLPRESQAPAGPPGRSKTNGSTDELAEDPAIDPSSIEHLRKVAESEPGFVPELIGVFLDDLGRRVMAIKAAQQSGDLQTLAQTAHTLKGSCGHFGARALMSLCLRLEKSARAGESDGLDVLVAQTEAESARVREALLPHRNQLVAPENAA